jgi:hypothetical protein
MAGNAWISSATLVAPVLAIASCEISQLYVFTTTFLED